MTARNIIYRSFVAAILCLCAFIAFATITDFDGENTTTATESNRHEK